MSYQLEIWYTHSLSLGKGPYSFWGHFGRQVVNLKVTGGQFGGSLEHNSKTFKGISMKPGTDTCLGAGKMPIYFGVIGVTAWQDVYSFWGQLWGQ